MPAAKRSDNAPLSGRRILVTRAADQAQAMVDRLIALGAEPVSCPTIAIVPPESYAELDGEIARLGVTDYLILTSVNAVEAFFARLAAAGQDARALDRVILVTVGPKTAEALAARGLRADRTPAEYQAEGVAELLCSEVAGKRVLYPRAALARDLIVRRLTEAGATVAAPVAYASTVPAAAAAIARMALDQGLDLLTFTAASTVRNFAALLSPQEMAVARTIPAAAIGQQTACAAREVGFNVRIEPGEATLEAMIAAIVAYYQETASPDPAP